MQHNDKQKQSVNILPHHKSNLASTPESRALVRHYYKRRKTYPIQVQDPVPENIILMEVDHD